MPRRQTGFHFARKRSLPALLLVLTALACGTMMLLDATASAQESGRTSLAPFVAGLLSPFLGLL